MDILDALVDLHKQATTERSHYYVAKIAQDAIVEIGMLRARVLELERDSYIARLKANAAVRS